MRQFLAVTAVALAIATPALAADGQSFNPGMQQAIAKAESYRQANQAQEKAAPRAATEKSATATDAGQASRANTGGR